ncbi:hypothetical protein V1508DRAFT_118956 [Lipomyces doorenjongii]|uniref:uncharacterized protein n=1 Tax=Lipomyces doorenjongii TaxID=383834 RepID=UPI0034CE489D
MPDMLLDHMTLYVTDIAKSRAFYDAILRVLNYKRCCIMPERHLRLLRTRHQTSSRLRHCNCARQISRRGPFSSFSCPSSDAVAHLYALGLENGGKDNGEPLLREAYASNYFAAFVW